MAKKDVRWRNLGLLVDEAAEIHGNKTLFIFGGERLSFRQVAERVNRAANVLRAIGVKKGDKVSLMLPNGFEFPILWLAIAKLGAVMVPTNINYQEHDLEYILNDSQAAFMVLHPDFVPVLEKVKPKTPRLKDVIVLGDAPAGYRSYDELAAAAPDAFVPEDVEQTDLVNIQYTSGTTGFPKGCMLTHRYWMLIGLLAGEFCDLGPEDVNLTAQPFYYMDPQWNTVLCLEHGIPLVIMHRFSPRVFWQTVKDNDVTFFYVLGTMPFYLLSLEENPELEQNHKLRFVICSGIYPQFHETFEKRWNVPWREAFGMTESGADMLVPLDDMDCVGSGAMGLAVPTKEVRVVDENDNPLPPGEIGELVVRGEPMMIGYWNNPEATAEIMRGGWLHTGDLVYEDEKGYFHWTGRLKDMIRRSGENISSVEVEGILAEHEKITAAAVVPVPDPLRGEEVKAYVVLNAGETGDSVSPESIVDFAKSKLAYFKVPRYVEFVDDLPMTPSERVAKHLLIAAKDDLRTGAYDAVDKTWR